MRPTCPTCGARLTCNACRGRAAGQRTSPAKAAAARRNAALATAARRNATRPHAGGRTKPRERREES
jgi:hypothetical protein